MRINLTNKKILALSGGGVKGLAHISVLRVLEENNTVKNFTTLAGTSVGAIIAFLMTIGYTSKEIYEFIMALDLRKLYKIDEFSTLISNYGFDKGTRLDYIIKNLLTQKNYRPDITFKDLHNKTGVHLIITGTNLNSGRGEYFDHLTEPDMPVKLAVRISVCIPLLCAPVKYKNSLYVDGGCTIPIPVDIFKDAADSVLAIDFVIPETESNIENLEDYVSTVFKTLYKNMTFRQCKGVDVVNIELDIMFADFNIDAEKKRQIYELGYTKARELLVSNVKEDDH